MAYRVAVDTRFTVAKSQKTETDPFVEVDPKLIASSDARIAPNRVSKSSSDAKDERGTEKQIDVGLQPEQKQNSPSDAGRNPTESRDENLTRKRTWNSISRGGPRMLIYQTEKGSFVIRNWSRGSTSHSVGGFRMLLSEQSIHRDTLKLKVVFCPTCKFRLVVIQRSLW